MKKRDDFEDQMRVYRGVIPWSVAEYDWVVANIKDMTLFSDIFHQRYPKKIEYDAHSYRFNQINKFLITHEDELFQLKLIYISDEKKHVDPQLMKALCTMLYDEEDFDETGEWIGNTFSFKDAIAQTKAKINKKPSSKRQTEEQGFNGLIPWSLAEFRWVMDQQMVQRKKNIGNQDLEDKYLPLKIQMRRQTGKSIDNFDTMILLNEIFHERYSNAEEAMAHFLRYRSIFMFVDEYKDQLIKEGLVDNTSGDLSMEPELIESLCILPYAFLYKEVVAKAKALRSARLN